MGARRWQHAQRGGQLAEVLTIIRKEIENRGNPILAYVVPYDVVKLQTGGGKRIAGVAKALSADFNVFILSLSPSSRPFSVRKISPGLWMVAIPARPEFEEKARGLAAISGGVAPLFAFAEHFDQLPEFHAVLESLSTNVRAWALASPMAWPPVRRFFKSAGQCLIYDAHDDMARFFRTTLGCGDGQMLKRAEVMEGEVLKQASPAFFCTGEDADSTQVRHPEAQGKIVVVPNGVDTDVCMPVTPRQARERRQSAGLDRSVAIFAGANYKPNHEAVDRIVRELAPAFPQIIFVVMGMHLAPYREFGGAELGNNVVFTGPVSEEIKEAMFSLSDVALAPMKSGTGSSLKIPDYIAHGKIVIATPIGLRGFEEAKQFASVVATDDICDALAQVLGKLAQDPGTYDESCCAAREWVASTLDWSVAAQPLVDALRVQLGR